MNFKYYLRRLQESSDYRKFIQENPNAYLCSGFFTIDKEGSDNKQHLDFFIPEKDKITSFQMEQEGKMTTIDVLDKKVPEKISLDFDIDFEEIENIVYEKMRTHGINNRIQKFIFSLQKIEGKDYLTGTVFISLFGLIKINIEIKTKKIVDFEKKSFFDLVNVFKKK
jgi:hypothetical protein